MSLEGQYLEEVSERFKYLGCLLINIKNLPIKRLPIYQDVNKSLCTPAIRRISRNYVSMINLTRTESYLDYNKRKKTLYFMLDDILELVKFEINDDGISHYSEFEDYMLEKSIQNIKLLEAEVIE